MLKLIVIVMCSLTLTAQANSAKEARIKEYQTYVSELESWAKIEHAEMNTTRDRLKDKSLSAEYLLTAKKSLEARCSSIKTDTFTKKVKVQRDVYEVQKQFCSDQKTFIASMNEYLATKDKTKMEEAKNAFIRCGELLKNDYSTEFVAQQLFLQKLTNPQQFEKTQQSLQGN